MIRGRELFVVRSFVPADLWGCRLMALPLTARRRRRSCSSDENDHGAGRRRPFDLCQPLPGRRHLRVYTTFTLPNGLTGDPSRRPQRSGHRREHLAPRRIGQREAWPHRVAHLFEHLMFGDGRWKAISTTSSKPPGQQQRLDGKRPTNY
jgi:hypothetical protein